MKLPDASSKYGAPMGRVGKHGAPDFNSKLTLAEVVIDSGGYDNGGAYWGKSEPLWQAVDDDGEIEMYLRAKTWDAAKPQVLETYPEAQVVRSTEPMGLDDFFDGYVTAALWSSTYWANEKGEPIPHEDESGIDLPIDENYGESDLSDAAKASMREDCESFISTNKENLALYEELGRNAAHAGHDFWLTRNGHGTGFWDRGFDKVGDDLSEAAKLYRSCDLSVEDDGKVYVN